jgi:murein DD-endopeptidase MepM/ murein hydrolase activator NlpD
MFVWPVPQWIPKYSFRERPRCFGAPRDGGKRKHAGCDLYAPEGSPVQAVWHGRVIAVYEFYGKADAVEIDHGNLGIIRYGELLAADEVDAGGIVEAGQVIGTITKLVGMGSIHPMLHFELYTGQGKGRLTQPGNDFHRRSDLVDPTAFLENLRMISAGLDFANVA